MMAIDMKLLQALARDCYICIMFQITIAARIPYLFEYCNTVA